MSFDLFTALPYVYRGLQEKEAVEEVIPRLKPYGIIARSLVQMIQNDADLWAKIEAVVHYVFPETGAPVLPSASWVQQVLNAWLAKTYPKNKMIVVDGKYGTETQTLMEEFQRDAGIEDDGMFGLETYMAMIMWMKKNGVTV